MENIDIIEKFYGVYLLRSLNPKYKGRTYIGFTVDPNRRIMQHNRGKQFGGAWKTSQRGPWEMTLIVHGFPSDVIALKFEWAWQHPKRSKRLKNVISNKKASETCFDYCLKVMFTMLRLPPWCRLPLILRWLSADVMVNPPLNLTPPMHMPIIYGPVKTKRLNKKKPPPKIQRASDEEIEMLHLCYLCYGTIELKKSLFCLNSRCQFTWHIHCLAKHFLDNEHPFAGIRPKGKVRKHLLPIEGICPSCRCAILWGDLIRKKDECHNRILSRQKEGNDESSNWLSRVS